MIELIAGNCLTFFLSGLISFLFGAVLIMLMIGISFRKAGFVDSVCFYGGMIFMAGCCLAWGMFLISLVVKFFLFIRGGS
jgi:hypothetical protein